MLYVPLYVQLSSFDAACVSHVIEIVLLPITAFIAQCASLTCMVYDRNSRVPKNPRREKHAIYSMHVI